MMKELRRAIERGVCGLVAACAATSVVPHAVAEATDTTPAAVQPAQGTGLSAESEAAARQFAAEHHPELAALLDQLEKTAPSEFAAALKELDGARRHVEGLRMLQPIDYELGLKEWKLMSRIRLRLAQMAPDEDPTLDDTLRTLVKELLAIRQQALRAEREFVMRRFDKITAALVEFERDSAAAVERELASLRKSLRNAPPRPTPAKK